jgi:hypothetical protein
MQIQDQAVLPILLQQYFSSVATGTSGISYAGWLGFHLDKAPDNCASQWINNGHCGWLFHKYDVITNGNPGKIFTTAYRSVSGDNNPADIAKRNVGPVPNNLSYKWGFDPQNNYQGFVSDTTAPFDPGKWRLFPWSVDGRCCFEVHGGSGSHAAPTPTGGCIRISYDGINSLKSMWFTRTDNRKQGAPVYIYYQS